MGKITDNVYGVVPQAALVDEIAGHLEELSLLGYSVMASALPTEQLPIWRQRIDAA